ncbi:MAG: helix-turn-helix transcriptional regulator [Ahrensia sp.]|nr:helix-turn-helix transcriptional regulator [Ahrensia sp.]
MFSHSQLWQAIDALAQQNDMSVSRLARNAGLDPTTFNKSKRTSSDGRPRWPSTESLAKIMQTTGTTMDEFTGLMDAKTASMPSGFREADEQAQFAMPQAIPLLGLAQAGSGGYFDNSGFPVGQGWDAVDFPKPDGQSVYALEISGDSMMPFYRDGDLIIVSPEASVRRGDRVVVRTKEGEVMAKVLARKTATRIELDSLNPAHENRDIALADVDWVARILWASQ